MAPYTLSVYESVERSPFDVVLMRPDCLVKTFAAKDGRVFLRLFTTRDMAERVAADVGAVVVAGFTDDGHFDGFLRRWIGDDRQWVRWDDCPELFRATDYLREVPPSEREPTE